MRQRWRQGSDGGEARELERVGVVAATAGWVVRIIHIPAGIMLDPAVRVRVRQRGRRARPVNERGCVDITPGR